MVVAVSANTVVVGAGVVGSACAYYLARSGREVILLEEEGIASGSSTHATGFLSLLSTDFRNPSSFERGVTGNRETLELVEELESLTGVDIQLQVMQGLRVAIDADEEATIRAAMEWQLTHVDAEWIDGAEALRIEPRLNPRVRGGLLEARSGQLDSARYTLALATGAERHGAEILTRRAVGIVFADDAVQAVATSAGDIMCQNVVVAMGVWAGQAQSWLGFPVPVRALPGERLLLRLPGDPLGFLLNSPRRGHMISRLDGYLSVGSTAGRDFD